MSKERKFKLGQFYTTRAKYIIGNLIFGIHPDKIIVEPFCGMGDLVISKNQWELYDIDPKITGCQNRDTLLNPPDYTNKLVITNPPFLAKNKNEDKTIYNLYGVNDLYKASIKSILGCDGGILIIPLNFLCDEDDTTRELFFQRFRIVKLNIFEETVFDDTAYTICSFLFEKINGNYLDDQIISCEFFPSREEIDFIISSSTGYRIGKEFFELIKTHKFNSSTISRLKVGDPPPNSNIFLRAIDTGSEEGRICLKMDEPSFYGKNSDRSFATIVFNKQYSLKEQEIICKGFNEILEKYRKQYKSMFLTNFRNSSSSYARKRISFDVAYRLINHVIKENQL